MEDPTDKLTCELDGNDIRDVLRRLHVYVSALKMAKPSGRPPH